MAVIKKYQNNFTAGALTPGAYARTDLQRYASGCKRIVNGIVHAHGGVSRRPGTLFVDSFPAGPCILIPFVYSVDQAYVLAFYTPEPPEPPEGEKPNYDANKAVLRIYSGGGVVLEDVEEGEPEVIFELETPYLPSELEKLKFTQSADTLFLAHPKHPPHRLIRYDHASWKFAELKFTPDIGAPTNLVATPNDKFVDKSGTYVVTDTYYKVSAVSGRQVESGPSIFATASTLSTWPQGARVNLTWDRVTEAERYEVYKNTRGYYAWIGSTEKTSFLDDNIEGDASLGPKENRDPFNRIDDVTVTSVWSAGINPEGEGEGIETVLVGVSAFNTAGVEGRMAWDPKHLFVLNKSSMAVGVDIPTDTVTVRIYVRPHSGTRWEYMDFRIPWGQSPEDEAKSPVKISEMYTPEGGGPRAKVTLYTSVAVALQKYRWTAGDPHEFLGKTYPGAVGIYQQRLIFGRSDAEPHTVWMSETGAFDSMAIANPLRDDSAITATVDSRQMNEIRHFVPLQDVLMLTSGAEFRLSAGSNADAITPTTINFKPQSYWGSNDVPPLVVGNNILFVTNSGKAVRDMRYQLADNGYNGEDVSILAEHLLNKPIVDWAYQQAPWNTIWICLADGKLLTFTYMKEQEVWAWSEHESSGGKFRSVSCIREGEFDHVYYIVERFGQNCVEYQQLREYGDDQEDAFFVDSGLSGNFTDLPVDHVTGLKHLALGLKRDEYREVVALCDGKVLRGLKVYKEGAVALGNFYKKVTVGLPYQTLVETMDPEINAQNGTTLGQRKALVRATFQVRETAGLKAGPTEDRLISLRMPPGLYSGTVEMVVDGLSRDEATIVFVQDDPLPMTVLSVASTISVG